MPAEQPAGDEVAETPAADPANDGLLSQYTRAIAYTHPDATWTCVQGMQYRFDGFAYGVAENDTDWLNEASVAVEAQMTCWDGYEENRLSTLTPPRGAEAAHEALHLWVSLNQNALVQLKEAESAHLNGNAAERDRRDESCNREARGVQTDALPHATGPGRCCHERKASRVSE